jgi:transcriptional regulator with XRE-family HTH domain
MNRNNIWPWGRYNEYPKAHSPFQKLIDSQRKHCGLSVRELAERIGVSQSTLLIWLHNLNGFPDPKSFNSEHVCRLGKALKISETEIKAALDASRRVDTPREHPMPHNTFDAFGRFIEILDNDKRETVSKSYVLNLAKNLYRGPKVTLLVLAGMLFAAISRADDPETLVAIKGKRFENAHVTEVTPATITIVHAAGIARVPLSELPADVQKKFGYDEAKAKARLEEKAREERARRDREEAMRAEAARKAAAEKKQAREEVDAIAHYLDDGGRLEYDAATHQLYDPDIVAARRREAIKFYQRYGYWPVSP